ncbi:MAG TPA: bifunctional methylenetetrahydrofolate dehydrogenase/methenyltetrahydrofolate cyclohydrolase FolD [Micropepsaceae bacterium]|nr:bifunctional methylenetetrahydrofolate dehydrogenase/methenyltetrahydrofolate cyclohydrolase FolD [Micropepsaceae bacterium]
MSARVIDGKAIGAALRARIADEARTLKRAHGITPGLAVVLVGDDAASTIYVSAKSKAAQEAGFYTFDIRHPAEVSQHALLAEVTALNGDSSVHGILVQMPLPKHIDTGAIVDAIDPLKDVDGLTATNAGRLMLGESGIKRGLVPCTPLGCLLLVREVLGSDIAGRDALVIGRSNLVGKPMAQLLLQESCTVTIAHSKTKALPELSRGADILIAALGRAEAVRGDWIKPGATVIDVGTTRRTLADGRNKLVGDVAYEEAVKLAGAITPVPGGVGPMTNACLMRNTLIAAALQAGLPQPDV